MVGVLQTLWGQTSPSPEAAPDAFIFEAQGGYYDRHRVQIPPKATGVRVKIIVLESYEDAHWSAATGLGIGLKKVENPNDMEMFARLSFDEKTGVHYIRLKTSTQKKDIVAKSKITPGTTLIWEADWSANRLVLRLNGQLFSNDVRSFPPEVLQLSVSGMKLSVDDITFTTPSP